MKKWIKIFLTIFSILCIILCLLAIWQWNNITAVVNTVTKSQDEIASEMDEVKQNLEIDIKEKYNTTVISDFTAEEERKIMKGEITVEDAIEILNSKNDSKTEQVSENKSPKDDKIDKLISDKTMELYSLKALYLGKLGQMEASAKKDYISLPKEKKNVVGRKELVSKYFGRATNLLTQCDKEVSAVIEELERELKNLKADTSIIKTIHTAYENEKALKKAYYIKLLGK